MQYKTYSKTVRIEADELEEWHAEGWELVSEAFHYRPATQADPSYSRWCYIFRKTKN